MVIILLWLSGNYSSTDIEKKRGALSSTWNPGSKILYTSCFVHFTSAKYIPSCNQCKKSQPENYRGDGFLVFNWTWFGGLGKPPTKTQQLIAHFIVHWEFTLNRQIHRPDIQLSFIVLELQVNTRKTIQVWTSSDVRLFIRSTEKSV